jgi:diguanylate cyclase (GGDEF) domain
MNAMENSSKDFLYQDLSYRTLLTVETEPSGKFVWLVTLLLAGVLTSATSVFHGYQHWLSVHYHGLTLSADPAIAVSLLSVLWFGVRWGLIPFFVCILLRLDLSSDIASVLTYTVSHLLCFFLIVQTYRSLPLSLNLRNLYAWLPFLFVTFIGCSVGAGAELLLSNTLSIGSALIWQQWWLSNWMTSWMLIPALLFGSVSIQKWRQPILLKQKEIVYSRRQVILSSLLLISGMVLHLSLSHSLALTQIGRVGLADENKLTLMSDTLLHSLFATVFMMMSLIGISYALFRFKSGVLLRRAQEATQGHETKSQILSLVTDEFCAPLQAMTGLIRLVLGSSLTSTQREQMNKIRASAALLNTQVNELLDYLKIEANQLELTFTAFALEELVHRLSSILSPRCSEKHLSLIIDLSPDIPRFLLGDPVRIEQILMNLLSHAIQSTDKGHVLLRIKAGQPTESQFCLLFEITDTGAGVSAEQIPLLFKPFQRANQNGVQHTGRNSLGMAISQQLIGLMGGEMKVSSAVGGGTQLIFSLLVGYRPDSVSGTLGFVCNKQWLILHNQPEVAAILSDHLLRLGGSVQALGHELLIQQWLSGQLSDEILSPDMLLITHHIGAIDGITLLRKLRSLPAWKTIPVLFLYPQSEEEKYRASLGGDSNTELLPLPFYGSLLSNAIMSVIGLGARTSISRLPANDWRNMLHDLNVLLVEDNVINRQVALETLQRVGVSVQIAENGKDGIEQASRGKFDLVLMDVDLPEVDGITATYWLRDKGYVIPIIAMTAFDDPKERERCLKAGMNDFMIKPFEPDTLYSLIYRWSIGDSESREAFKQPLAEHENLTIHDAPSEIALDVILGFSRVGNNPYLYQQILSSFRDEYSDQGRQLLIMVEQEKWAELERVAHNLKSVSRYIGADALSLAAQELELLFRRQEARASRAILAKKLVANIHVLLMAVFDIIKSIPVIAINNHESHPAELETKIQDKQHLPKILVIDDELIHRQMLSSLLEHDGDIITVSSGSAALELVSKQAVDLILLDMVMPDMRGDEIMRALRSHVLTREIDIVIISSHNDVEDEETGFLLGATDYISKPFHPTIVQARIRNVLRMIHQRRLLDQLAHLDGLTGIPNRRKFEQVIENEWMRHEQTEQPLSLAILDVDHFKRFNDTYGHARGDDVLQAVAGAIRNMLRRTGDFTARLGGEEFVLVFSGVDASTSAVMADQIRQAMERIDLPVGKITVSIGGVTLVPKGNTSLTDAMESADQLLYQAKQNGRNQVCWQSKI